MPPDLLLLEADDRLDDSPIGQEAETEVDAAIERVHLKIAPILEGLRDKAVAQFERRAREGKTMVAAGGEGTFEGGVEADDLFRFNEWEEVVTEEVGPDIEELVRDASDDAADDVGVGLTRQEVFNAAARHTASLTQYGRAVQTHISSVLEQGLRKGWAVQKVADKLASGPLDIDATLALRIAQTEVIAAQNGGRAAVFRKSPVPLDVYWLATPDERTRHSHTAMDRTSVRLDLGQSFTVGEDNETADYPGDPRLSPKERAN